MRTPALLSSVAAALLACACAGPPTPGSPGLQDSYFDDVGNGGYDVQHYALSLGIVPAGDTAQPGHDEDPPPVPGGERPGLDTTSVLAANPALHATLLDRLGGFVP